MQNAILRRIGARLKGQMGFSLTEVLIGGVILVVGLVTMTQLFASGANRVLESNIRSVCTQVANDQIEYVRSLNYDQVMTKDLDPNGAIDEYQDKTVSNVAVHIHTTVKLWTDSSYSGPYPGNYRRVQVDVWPVGKDEKTSAVVVTTNVAGGVEGGTLNITVQDVGGHPVPDAHLTITNAHLGVNMTSSALDTDSNGKTLLPGLTPDNTASYVVTATKEGYSTAVSSPQVVVDGSPYTVIVLTIDKLSTLTVSVVDSGGNPVTGMNLTIAGPDSYSQSFVSAATPVSFSGIRYSTDTDPYIISLLTGQGYSAQQKAVTLNPDSTQNVVFTVTPVTTTTAAVTTTTATQGTSTLKITVLKNSNGNPLSGARVALSPGGQVLTTNSSGQVLFTQLVNQTYTVVVTCNNYYDYRPISPTGDIVVNGATTATVYLTHK